MELDTTRTKKGVRNLPLRDEEECLKFELTLDREVLDSKMIFPVI